MKNEKDIQEDKDPKDTNKPIITDQFIEQLKDVVDYFHRLPRHEQFSFVTNSDLYYQMTLVVNTLNDIYTQIDQLNNILKSKVKEEITNDSS